MLLMLSRVNLIRLHADVQLLIDILGPDDLATILGVVVEATVEVTAEHVLVPILKNDQIYVMYYIIMSTPRSYMDIISEEKHKNMSEDERKLVEDISKKMTEAMPDILEAFEPRIIHSWSDGTHMNIMYKKSDPSGSTVQCVEKTLLQPRQK
jgi:hypothetical protein